MSTPFRLAVRASLALDDKRRGRLRPITVDQRRDLRVMADLDIDRLAGTTHNHSLYGLVTP